MSCPLCGAVLHLVESWPDEMPCFGEGAFDCNAKLSQLVCHRSRFGIARSFGDRLPRCHGSSNRNQRNLRGPVPVALHGIVFEVLSMQELVKAVQRSMQFGTNQMRVPPNNFDCV